MADVEQVPTKQPSKREIRATGRIIVAPERVRQLEAWLEHRIGDIEQAKARARSSIERTRKVLDGDNPDPPLRAGFSNFSVPLTMWHHRAAHSRLSRAILKPRPMLRIRRAGPRDESDLETVGALNAFADFITQQVRSGRALDGESVIKSVAASMSAEGTGQWAVIFDPPVKRLLPPLGDEDKPREVEVPGRVRWQQIRWDDLLYFDGYGTDVNTMPFVGYVTDDKRWADLVTWGDADHYDTAAVEAVRNFYAQRSEAERAEIRTHRIAEIYTDIIVDKSGTLAPVVIDYHKDARRILRIAWNRWGGVRPIVAAQFDEPARPGDYLGSGTGRKLEGAQTEISQIHNIGVESGKRGIGHITVVNSESALDDELGGDEIIVPGDVYSTGNPREDIQVLPIGDARAAQFTVALEGVVQQYAERIMAQGGSAFGDVGSGKRVPARLGVPIMQQGAVGSDSGTASLARATQEALYLTITAYQQQVPAEQLRAVLNEDGLRTLSSLVFNPADPNLRERVQITITAADTEGSEDTKQQKLMMVVQLLISWYERVVQMLTMTLQLPSATPLLKTIIEKMTNAMEELLKATQEVEDPEDLLITMRELNEGIEQMLAPVGGAPATEPTNGAGQPAFPTEDDTDTPDLGGGVV